MALRSEERRRLVVDTIRRDGQLTRGGDRSAFAVALASVEFDLAGVLKDDHAAVAGREDSLYTGATRTLALEALRCDVNVYDLLDWAVDQAPVPDAEFTEFVVALLEALPLTTLPALPERPYYEHHAFNAQIAMKARHLCPSPLPEYAVETWDTVARWALHPALIEAERERLYQKHLGRDWPRTDPERDVPLVKVVDCFAPPVGPTQAHSEGSPAHRDVIRKFREEPMGGRDHAPQHDVLLLSGVGHREKVR